LAPLAALWLLASVSGCNPSEAPVLADAPTPVAVAAAVSGPAVPPISANGIVANKDEMRLSFKVGGVIHSIDVQEGSVVAAGQTLAAIEQTEVEAQVEQARQLATKAQRDLARGENLYADQVISLEQLQNLRTQAALAQAQLKSIEFNRGYAVITAPGPGVVLRRLAEERELVPAGQPVLILGGAAKGFVVRSALSDREIVTVELGDRGTVQLDAFPNQTFDAVLSEIASASDAATGLFDIELRLEQAPAGLVSGLVARVRLLPSAGTAGTLTYVPMASLVQGDGKRATVFVLENDIARKRDVTVAFIAADTVALQSGVVPGTRVVTDGSLYLEDGERVRIVVTGNPDSA